MAVLTISGISNGRVGNYTINNNKMYSYAFSHYGRELTGSRRT